MRFFKALLAAVILFTGIPFSTAYAKSDSYGEAVKLIDSGEYSKAEEILRKLLSAEPNNARFHQSLGDALRKEGKLDESISEYEKARRLGAENPELLKGMGTSYKWMKDYEKAKASYKRALELNPNDREAKDDLQSLERRRGLGLTFAAGGNEPDYTTSSYEVALSYGGFDKLDLYAGYGYSDQIYYKRSKVYAKGYYFYDPKSYLQLYVARKDYSYPVDPAVQKPNPDSTSYDIVPVVALELSHWFSDDFRGTLAYEYFRPSFFYDPDTTANNHKVSAEAYYITPMKYLRLKLLYAVLRDPDPDKTEIKGRNNPNTPLGVAASTQVKYETQSLLGGGVELVTDKWDADFKYLPNRDLDSSYSYSILAGAGYNFTGAVRGRFDYVHDKYSSKSTYSGKTADVYLVSAFYKIDPSVDLGVGYKHIVLPAKTDDTGFITISYRTGLGF